VQPEATTPKNPLALIQICRIHAETILKIIRGKLHEFPDIRRIVSRKKLWHSFPAFGPLFYCSRAVFSDTTIKAAQSRHEQPTGIEVVRIDPDCTL
jgi:hypothetical protein